MHFPRSAPKKLTSLRGDNNQQVVPLWRQLFRLFALPGTLSVDAKDDAAGGLGMAWNGLRSALGGLLGSKNAKGGAASTHYHITNPYHAVSIVPGAVCCGAARELRTRRFLSKEAPPLPLKACTANGCRCAYRHYDDRRTKSRRASDRIGQPPPFSGAERRAACGRRQTDA
jgi:hypothetical protein